LVQQSQTTSSQSAHNSSRLPLGDRKLQNDDGISPVMKLYLMKNTPIPKGEQVYDPFIYSAKQCEYKHEKPTTNNYSDLQALSKITQLTQFLQIGQHIRNLVIKLI